MDRTTAVFTSASATTPAYISVPGADTALSARFAWLAAATSPIAAPVELVEGIPRMQVEAYAQAASRYATVCEVDPSVWFASVAGLDGAWGEGDSAEEARRDLHEAIVGWVAVRRRLGLEIPVIGNVNLNSQDRSA
jgi:predicted RNase H-like HicB family nuclease